MSKIPTFVYTAKQYWERVCWHTPVGSESFPDSIKYDLIAMVDLSIDEIQALSFLAEEDTKRYVVEIMELLQKGEKVSQQ